MTLGALLGLWLAMWAADGTPVGCTLRNWMVERPARRLSRVTRGQILLLLVLTGAALALIWLLENDGRMLVAMGLPDVVSMAVAIDAASLLDLTLVAVVAASAIRVRAVAAWIRPTARPRRPRNRVTRTRRTRPPANDDEERPALAA